MKRDFDLIRRILQDIEKLPAGKTLEELEYSEYDQDTILAHAKLLIEKGLIEGKIVGGTGWSMIRVTGLTWSGYDFLDASKDETIWAKAKVSVLKPTASFTFDLLLEWLKTQAKEKLGLP
jgi:hypothetical protein